MDRMDYLKRIVLPGVAEGNVNSERLIQMMNVVDDYWSLKKKEFTPEKS
jgi:HD superfamily phosphohydrolase